MGVDFELEIGRPPHGRDERIGCERIEYAERVGDAETARAGGLGGGDRLDQKIDVRTRAVLAADRDVEAPVAGVSHHARKPVERGRAAAAELGRDLDVGHRNRQIDHCDAGIERGVHILGAHPTPGDRGQRKPGRDDGADGGDLLPAHGRRAGLELGDAGLRKRARDRDLLLDGEGDAGRLLAVAQRRVVEHDAAARPVVRLRRR